MIVNTDTTLSWNDAKTICQQIFLSVQYWKHMNIHQAMLDSNDTELPKAFISQWHNVDGLYLLNGFANSKLLWDWEKVVFLYMLWSDFSKYLLMLNKMSFRHPLTSVHDIQMAISIAHINNEGTHGICKNEKK